MEAIADQVSAALAELQAAAGAEAAIDVYLTASPYRGEAPSVVSLPDLDVQNIMYFGGQNPAQLIVQFEELRQGGAYDAILVFTDGSGYELGQSQEQAAIPEAPLWMVHLGGDLPLGYDDQTLEAIQVSGGGVAADLKQALERIAFAEASGQEGENSEGALRDMVDGRIWSTLPTALAQSEASEAQVHRNDGFEALAARRQILAEMQRQKGAIDEIETLDRLHALAKNYEVVTPYSSMIVLVNDDQRRLLEAMEKQGDRFEREVEAVGETTPAVQTPLTGVPEPEEWLLIGLAVALLIWYASRRRFAWQRHTPG